MGERTYRRLFLVLALAGGLLDQASKYAVFRWMSAAAGAHRIVVDAEGARVVDYPLVDGYFDLSTRFTNVPADGSGPLAALRAWNSEMLPYVNHGALFGERFSLPPQHSNTLFAVICVLAAVAITWWAGRPSASRDRALSAALGLILAGTLGNLYDRLVFHGVRDFLHLHYQDRFYWPVFNIADCCLVCGALFLLAQAFFGRPAVESAATPPVAAGASQEAAHTR